jgi:hypothetical protein
VNEMGILKNSKDLFKTYNICSSPPATALKQLPSLTSTHFFLTQAEGQIKGVGPTAFHKKRRANVDTNTLCQERTNFIL